MKNIFTDKALVSKVKNPQADESGWGRSGCLNPKVAAPCEDSSGRKQQGDPGLPSLPPTQQEVHWWDGPTWTRRQGRRPASQSASLRGGSSGCKL